MSKIKDAMFTDTPLESAADMLSGDPDYPGSVETFGEWTREINDNFNEVFGDDAKEAETKPPF